MISPVNQRLIAEIGKSQRLRVVNRLKRTQGLSVGELATALGIPVAALENVRLDFTSFARPLAPVPAEAAGSAGILRSAHSIGASRLAPESRCYAAIRKSSEPGQGPSSAGRPFNSGRRLHKP